MGGAFPVCDIPHNRPGYHRPDGGAEALHNTAGQQQAEVVGQGANCAGDDKTDQAGHQCMPSAEMIGGNTRRDLPERKPGQVQADNQLGAVGIDLQISADQ